MEISTPPTTLAQKLRFLAIAGVGFLSDGYLNLTIGLGRFLPCAVYYKPVLTCILPVVPMLGYLYFQDSKSSVPTTDGDTMKGALSVGMIIGQITFGMFGDAWGRHNIYGKELMVTIFGNLMVILLPWKSFSPQAVTAWVSVFRVVTGVGIGAGPFPRFPLPSFRSFLTMSRLPHVICAVSREKPAWLQRGPDPLRLLIHGPGEYHGEHRVHRLAPSLQVRYLLQLDPSRVGVASAAGSGHNSCCIDFVCSVDHCRDDSLSEMYVGPITELFMSPPEKTQN